MEATMSTIAFHPTAFVRVARPAARSATQLRLTSRGRVVLFVVVVLAIMMLAVTFGSSTTATIESGTPAATYAVTVKPGQTLWQIAIAANPDGDVRQTVDEIMELNSLASAGGLQMGREIAVPIYN